MKFVSVILLFLGALSLTGSALELDGKTVILLVSEHRSGDVKMEAVKSRLLQQRTSMGYTKETMPIVFMGFKDSDTERKYFDRLGFQEFDSPVLCVVEWGNPARFGPKKVLDYAIARSATPQHVDFILDNYLALSKGEPITPPPPIDPPVTSGEVEIIRVRFEASGKPLYLTNAGIRIRNNGSTTVRDITIRFYSKITQEDGWSLMGKKTLDKLVSGYFASRDIVGDTREMKLTDPEGNAIPCFYRIEVEFGGKVIYEEGKFIPNEDPV